MGRKVAFNAEKKKNQYTNSKNNGKIKQRGDGGFHMSMVLDVDTTVFDVAEFFLSQERPNERWDITHLKLQKLVYYAQGWSLALRDNRPLFQNKIEAWSHGPVCTDLYRRYRQFGFSIIPQIHVDNMPFSDDDRDLLLAVWSKYGFKDARALEFMTHEETPWKNAWRNVEGRGRRNSTITTTSMGAYFSSLLSR